MPVDIEEVLLRWKASGIDIALETMPNGLWRATVSENDGDKCTLRPGHPGFSVPSEAIEDIDGRIANWLAARANADAANVESFLNAGRLERRPYAEPETGESEMRWAAQADSGEWLEGFALSGAAVRAAMNYTVTP